MREVKEGRHEAGDMLIAIKDHAEVNRGRGITPQMKETSSTDPRGDLSLSANLRFEPGPAAVFPFPPVSLRPARDASVAAAAKSLEFW